MSGSLYETFSRVMKVFVGKKVTIPGSFKRYICTALYSCYTVSKLQMFVNCIQLYSDKLYSYLQQSTCNVPYICNSWLLARAVYMYQLVGATNRPIYVCTYNQCVIIIILLHPPAKTTRVQQHAQTELLQDTCTLLIRGSYLFTNQLFISSLMELPQ